MSDKDEENPWTTLSSEVRYDNPWIRVTEHQVLTPAGTPGIYGVMSPKNFAVAVVPIFADGSTMLVGQYRYALSRYSWEICEGGCPKGEEPLEAARRELREETGCSAAEWLEILRMDMSNSISDEQSWSYVAWDLAHGEAEPEETEQLKLRRVALAEAVRMVEAGEITDALSVATLLRLELMRREKRLPPGLAACLG